MADEVAATDTDPDPLKREMIRDHSPHPLDLVGNFVHDYEHVDDGKWLIEAESGGWNEDLVHGLWMEGYHVRGTDTSERGNVIHTVVEDRRLETEVCPACGDRHEPNDLGSTECPNCGGMNHGDA